MKKNLLFSKNSKYCQLFLALILAFFAITNSFAQNKQITGKVTASEDGSNLPGVSIQVKGTTVGTVSTVNGNYSISAPANSTLVFSFIGYTKQEVAVGNRGIINVKLASDATTLKEVNVVSVGYGTVRKKDLTGSVSSVTPAQIAATPVTTLDQAIQGRASGVQVTNNDGAPGGGVQIQIRGIGSLGSNDPLYVVDGYPQTGNINSLNTNDIASIDILKDASATAIYGNRASNGVVIITTKRGGKNGVQLSVDALTSVQARPKTYKLLNAPQWATLATQLGTIDGFSTLPEWNSPNTLRTADWQDALYQTGLRQQYNVALRGGSDKVQSAFSAGYFDQKGIVVGSLYKRINLGLNLDYNAYKWLKSSSSFKYSRTDNKVAFGSGGQGAGVGIGYLNHLPPTITGNKLTDQISDGNGNYGFFNPTNVNVKSWSNPLYLIETQDQKNLSNFFQGVSSLEATIFDGLKIKTNFGITTNDYSGYYFTPTDTRALVQYGQGTQTSTSFYTQNANNNYEYLWENTLSYSKTFGQHSIDFVGGISQQANTFRQIGISGNGSVSDVLRDVASITTITNSYGNQTPSSLASQFARLNYKFMDKYLITGTVRRDGSSKFAKGNQYGIFPSVSVAWRVKEESFLKNVEALNDLKFRASYGQVGNQNGIGTFQYLSQYSTGGPATSAANVGYPFGKVYQPGVVLNSLPNPDLKWETSKKTNIGLDAAFLDGSLTLTVDYYKNVSKDFLLLIPVPAQTGFTTAARNVGSISNSGIEFSLNYNKSVKDFKYGIGLNVSTVNNKLLSLSTGQNAITNLDVNTGGQGFNTNGVNTWSTFSNTHIGGPVGAFYGYKAVGIFQNQAEIDAYNAKSVAKRGAGAVYQAPGPTKPGDRIFADVNGDGQVTADDRVDLGSPIPKVFGGLDVNANYKSFDFDAFFYGVAGNKIFNYQKSTLESFQNTTGAVGIENISQEYYDNRWTPTNPSNRYARATGNDQNGNARPSDLYIENGSYLRLRNVQLGYSLPVSLVSKIGVSRFRIYASAQNLFTLTKYSGLDPEIGQPTANDGSRRVTAAGIDVGTYPTSRFYTLGLNVTF